MESLVGYTGTVLETKLQKLLTDRAKSALVLLVE